MSQLELISEFEPENLTQALLSSGIDEAELVSNVILLSQNFTSSRQKIGQYLSDEKMVSAYTWFYLPTNSFKLQFLWQQLSDSLKQALSECQLIDVGTGPGTYAYTWKKITQTTMPIVGVDHSDLMIAQARKLNQLFAWAGCDFVTNAGDIKPNNNRKVLFFGNSLNENAIDFFQQMLKQFDPDFVIFIEPGTPQTYTQLMEVRQLLISRNWNVIYPCLSNHACPMSKEDWCHQVVYPKLGQGLNRITQLTKLDRRTLPAIIHLYAKNSEWNLSERNDEMNVDGRTVQFMGQSKFSLDYRVCTPVNEINKIEYWEIPSKTLTRTDVKKLETQGIGIKLHAKNLKVLACDKRRVSLSKI